MREGERRGYRGSIRFNLGPKACHIALSLHQQSSWALPTETEKSGLFAASYTRELRRLPELTVLKVQDKEKKNIMNLQAASDYSRETLRQLL